MIILFCFSFFSGLKSIKNVSLFSETVIIFLMCNVIIIWIFWDYLSGVTIKYNCSLGGGGGWGMGITLRVYNVLPL